MAKVNTPEFRLAWPHLFEPQVKRKAKPGDKPRWNCTMLFEKGQDISVLKKAVRAILVEKFGDKSKWPKKWRSPFNDQGEYSDKYAGYVDGATLISAWRDDARPGVVDNQMNAIIESSEIYAGCYCIASVNPFYYDHPEGGKGISFGLGNVQKIRNGDPIGNITRPEDDFEAVEVDSDDDFEETIDPLDDDIAF